MLDDFDPVLERARAGSGDAVGLIYEDLARPVAAYLRAKGVHEVEDVTSEVFLAVFTGLGRFTGDQVQFRSWVFTIAHRRVVDGWRRGGRAPAPVPYEPAEDTRTSPSAEAGALESVGTDRAMELLATLTDDQREVLVLRVVADLTVEDVAAVVGKRPGAVKALQRRGLATLRRQLVTEGVPL
ncbi:RNA polymerase sigma factor [Cellulomonas soli]|uniref:RNA polymerase sigma24 factor n=1 Tax=Cellulomonas soli TaxID=931535 RepID=A0A512PDY7_9CELL|nr:sigma-70 family RNA polymerase sigma factor [Cellulomonas soli]NYI59091.1 RNA polymerase sigma-70 factor (ECF subfamily) [Cellulomonas soli]GEP69418.1 RNA polymerase sigma24 factor [Cellulomonas soli]